jgi:hypothetical protein
MAPALDLLDLRGLPAPATNTAFAVVFGVFVVAMVVLIVIIIVWAVRHDIAGRRAWRARREGAWPTQAREDEHRDREMNRDMNWDMDRP